MRITRMIKIPWLLVLAIFLLGCSASCNKNDPAVHSLKKIEEKPSTSISKKIGDSKNQKLSSILYELSSARDPEDFANKHNIFLDKDRVRVFVFFEPSSSGAGRENVIEFYKIVVEKRSTDMVRAQVNIDTLVPLSEESVIRSIQLPARLIKAK